MQERSPKKGRKYWGGMETKKGIEGSYGRKNKNLRTRNWVRERGTMKADPSQGLLNLKTSVINSWREKWREEGKNVR